MSLLDHATFGRGWVPDADPVNGPPDALLRADNLILDEIGALSVRPGSAKINGSALADTDVHSLFTATLSGTRYRMVGAAAAVYANGSSIASGLAGSGDIAFGSALGQILFARSTSKKQYDGTTVRNLGISMTGGAPTVAAVSADTKVLASCDSGENTWTAEEGTIANAANAATTANSAKLLTPDTVTGRIIASLRYAADTDFTTYAGATVATDDDLLSFFIKLAEPNNLIDLTLSIDVYGGAVKPFAEDRYSFTWSASSPVPLDPPTVNDYDADPNSRQPPNTPNSTQGTNISSSFQLTDEWQKLSVRRGDLARTFGAGVSATWATVRGIRVIARMAGGGAGSAITVDDVRLTSAAIVGLYKWAYIYVRNGTSVSKSAPSAFSAETPALSQSATITAPSDGSRDSQINEIWLYRFVNDDFYRVTVKTGVSGTGSVAITDALSDVDALTLGIRLERDNSTPPDNIISIAGTYYDRVFYLTTAGDLYPSRRLIPGTCSTGQVIHVAGVDETPYWVKKTLTGLFIGTSKDVYVVDGTGAELPDGSIEFTLRALNIDHPPIGESVAQEGNQLVYLANDGWRAMQGAGTELLPGATSLLYRGYTRHGVSAVNLATGRFRAAIAKGQLVTTTPEGASTTSTSVLYRLTFLTGLWYRHTYGSQAWRCVHREPDGTLIASDTAGFVWILDTGTQDGSTDIAVIAWTTQLDGGAPFSRKDPQALRVIADTGSNTATVAIHLDGSASSATTVAVAQNGIGTTVDDISDIAAFTRVQYRITGSFSTFRLARLALDAHPLPLPFFGTVVPSNAGYAGIKTLSGLQLRICTRGAAVTITPIIDGTDQTAFSVTSATDEPVNATLAFAAAVDGAELAFRTSADVELYDWAPLVTAQQPLGVYAYDSGPLDLGVQDLVWAREVLVKVRASANLTITPYFDDRAFPAVTGIVTPGRTTIVSVPVGRNYVGRTPRLVMTSTAPFYPYWVRLLRRATTSQSDKRVIQIPLTVGGTVAA